ncbi:MAG: sulfite exporter TauE/SafE family protein [Isosphaeraceae bacterium]
MNQDGTSFLPVVMLGFVAGILSGMFGIGGGLVIVPALMFLFELPIKTATGTSLFALLWPVGILGVFAYHRSGNLDVWKGAWIAVGLFFGAYLGAKITLALPPTTMKRVYAVFLLLVGSYYLWSPTPPRRGEAPAAAPAPAPAPAADQVH